MTPEEIQGVQRDFPVGRILDLSGKAVQVLIKLTDMRDSLTFLNEEIVSRLGGQETLQALPEETGRAKIKETYDTLMREEPLKAMVCQQLGGFGSPMGQIFASQNAEIIQRLRWAIIYEDLVNHYRMIHETWHALKLKVIDNPRCGGVMVTGYDFKAEDIEPTACSREDEDDEGISIEVLRQMMEGPFDDD